MPNEVSTFATITHKQVQSALSNEHYYSDHTPHWKNQPTSADAIVERISRIRLFRKHDDRKLARKLNSCKPDRRCRSGACPECTRAIQRQFVRQTYKLAQPPSEFQLVSLVPPEFGIANLKTFSIEAFRNSLADRLASSGIASVIGGIDYSLNEHAEGRFEAYWSPHVWFLTTSYRSYRWSALLRQTFPGTSLTPRPIKIEDWDGRRRAIGYSLKYEFQRRISLTDTRQRRGGGTRKCRATRYDRLRSAERFELYSHLHEIGLGARLLLMGFETNSWPELRISE